MISISSPHFHFRRLSPIKPTWNHQQGCWSKTSGKRSPSLASRWIYDLPQWKYMVKKGFGMYGNWLWSAEKKWESEIWKSQFPCISDLPFHEETKNNVTKCWDWSCHDYLFVKPDNKQIGFQILKKQPSWLFANSMNGLPNLYSNRTTFFVAKHSIGTVKWRDTCRT